MFKAQFFMASSKKKNLDRLLIKVWVLGRVEKMPKKGSKKRKKNIFFVLNKYQSVTHVSTCIFIGLFKNIVFRSVALYTKKAIGYFRFFSQTGLFFRPVPYPVNKKLFTNTNFTIH